MFIQLLLITLSTYTYALEDCRVLAVIDSLVVILQTQVQPSKELETLLVISSELLRNSPTSDKQHVA